MKEGSGIRVHIAKPTPRSSYKELPSQMLQALMWGPKTKKELGVYTGAVQRPIRAWLEAWRAEGVVYIIKFRGGSAVYALQNKPFEQPDYVPERRHRKETPAQGVRVPEKACGVAA